jgi:hypothetical protein
MFADGPTASPPSPCPTCRNPVDVRSRHIVVRGSAVRVYCSEACKSGSPTFASDDAQRSSARPVALIGAVVASGALAATLLLWSSGDQPLTQGALTRVNQILSPETAEPLVDDAQPDKAKEEAWIAELAQDAWIHPLAGPSRRMPIRDSRTFGAERPGDRPIECGSGHCGVDIGGEIWGEPVMAVHDGVVVRVQRNLNPDHGGLYVRLAHRGGTVYSQYFHLAAIPSKLKIGDTVKMGEVVGLIGDSGVVNSGPHLHFTISVLPDKEQPEQYIDPEVLIALWPLKLTPARPGEGAAIALASPGNVRGPFGPRRGNKMKAKQAARAARRAAAADSRKGRSGDKAEAADADLDQAIDSAVAAYDDSPTLPSPSAATAAPAEAAPATGPVGFRGAAIAPSP